MKYCIIVFANTHSAMAAEKALLKQFEITVLPTPRSISQSCGIAIRFCPRKLNDVISCLKMVFTDDRMYDIYGFSDGGYAKIK